MSLHKILRADAAGPAYQRMYEKTHVALAGLVPLALLTPDGSVLNKAADVALAVALPVHSHVALNSVVSDYLPKSRIARWGVLGTSVVAFAGLLKLSLAGPGLSHTVKNLWRKPQSADKQ